MKDIVLHGKQLVSMKKMKTELKNKSPHLIDSILFLYAISGCDMLHSPRDRNSLGVEKQISGKKILKTNTDDQNTSTK